MEKFAIQDITRESVTDESALEFQVYSSHHMTRRHLVGMASIFLKDVDKFENGLAELVILPHSVYRVSAIILRLYSLFLEMNRHGEITWVDIMIKLQSRKNLQIYQKSLCYRVN